MSMSRWVRALHGVTDALRMTQAVMAAATLVSTIACCWLFGPTASASLSAMPSVTDNHAPGRSANVFNVELKPPGLLKPTADNHVFVSAGILPPDSHQSRSFVLPKLAHAKMILLGRGVSWSFRSPKGQVIAPKRPGKHTGFEYSQDERGVAALRLDDPERGKWTVTISSNVDTLTKYAMDIWADGPAEETAHLELMVGRSEPGVAIVARPGDTVFVRTFIVNGGKLVQGATWDVRASVTPDGEVTIPVFDDGAHADGASGDGVFVGAIVVEGQNELYQPRAEGRTLQGAQYWLSGTIQVHGKSDLLIADSIEVSPRHPKAGEPVTLTVTVMNDGAGEFKNVALELYVDRAKESEQWVDLKPGESRRVRTTWVPPGAASYVVQLTLAPWQEPYWSDFKNNTKRATVRVR